jgi:hypothetical protein
VTLNGLFNLFLVQFSHLDNGDENVDHPGWMKIIPESFTGSFLISPAHPDFSLLYVIISVLCFCVLSETMNSF